MTLETLRTNFRQKGFLFGKEIGDRKLLLWLPTFLQHSNTQFAEASIETGFGFSGIRNHQELMQLNDHCIRSGAVCIIKRHPSQSIWGTGGTWMRSGFWMTGRLC